MRALVILTIVFILMKQGFSQGIEAGKYRLCYDIFWKCHFQHLLELKSDSTYKFIYLDDMRQKETQGTWRTDSGYVVLTPFTISAPVQITSVSETPNAKFRGNLISVSEFYHNIPKLEVHCFLNGEKKILTTDSTGDIHYNGKVIDSLTFTLKGQKLTVIPKQKSTPSMIKIMVNTNFEDLVYEQLGTNKIMIQNGKMVIEYLDDNDELKTEFFEKID